MVIFHIQIDNNPKLQIEQVKHQLNIIIMLNRINVIRSKLTKSFYSAFILFSLTLFLPNNAQSQSYMSDDIVSVGGSYQIPNEAIDLSANYHRAGGFGLYVGFASDYPLRANKEGKSSEFTRFGLNYTSTNSSDVVSNRSYYAGVKFAKFKNVSDEFDNAVLFDIGILGLIRGGGLFSASDPYGLSWGMGLNFGEIYLFYATIGIAFDW